MGKITIKKISKELDQKVQPEKKAIRASLSDEHIGEFYNIPIERIVPYHKQSRILFDPEELEDLSKTIKKHGIRQPLTVILNSNDQYEVVSGERRLRAAKLAGLKRVPCIILKDPSHAEELAIIENVQRKDLHPVELANSLNTLIEKGYSQKEVSEKLSINKSFVSETLKILTLDNEIRQFLVEKKITSRDMIRDIVSGKQNMNVLKKQITSDSHNKHKRSKSIFRVGVINGEFVIQKATLSRLSSEQKAILKRELSQIVKEYLN